MFQKSNLFVMSSLYHSNSQELDRWSQVKLIMDSLRYQNTVQHVDSKITIVHSIVNQTNHMWSCSFINIDLEEYLCFAAIVWGGGGGGLGGPTWRVPSQDKLFVGSHWMIFWTSTYVYLKKCVSDFLYSPWNQRCPSACQKLAALLLLGHGA